MVAGRIGCFCAAMLALSILGTSQPAHADDPSGGNDVSPYADPEPHLALVPVPPRPLPSHFQSEDRYYDFSIHGLRLRIESLKESDPVNYARLDNELTKLENRETATYVLVAVGIVAPFATWGVYAATRSEQDCPPMPSASTPNFQAASAAWFDCNQAKNQFNPTPLVVGIGLMVASFAGALIVAPKRSDLLEFVNLHNRLTSQPIRWELGYDPQNRSGYAGAALSF